MTYFKKSWERANRDLKLKFNKKEEIKQDPLSEEVKDIFSEDVDSKSKEPVSEFIENQRAVDIATPYKVVNMTGNMIFVETLFDVKKEKYILKDRTTAKIAISYEKQTIKNYEIESSKMNDSVKILFEGLHLPIESTFPL